MLLMLTTDLNDQWNNFINDRMDAGKTALY